MSDTSVKVGDRVLIYRGVHTGKVGKVVALFSYRYGGELWATIEYQRIGIKMWYNVRATDIRYDTSGF